MIKIKNTEIQEIGIGNVILNEPEPLEPIINNNQEHKLVGEVTKSGIITTFAKIGWNSLVSLFSNIVSNKTIETNNKISNCIFIFPVNTFNSKYRKLYTLTPIDEWSAMSDNLKEKFINYSKNLGKNENYWDVWNDKIMKENSNTEYYEFFFEVSFGCLKEMYKLYGEQLDTRKILELNYNQLLKQIISLEEIVNYWNFIVKNVYESYYNKIVESFGYIEKNKEKNTKTFFTLPEYSWNEYNLIDNKQIDDIKRMYWSYFNYFLKMDDEEIFEEIESSITNEKSILLKDNEGKEYTIVSKDNKNIKEKIYYIFLTRLITFVSDKTEYNKIYENFERLKIIVNTDDNTIMQGTNIFNDMFNKIYYAYMYYNKLDSVKKVFESTKNETVLQFGDADIFINNINNDEYWNKTKNQNEFLIPKIKLNNKKTFEKVKFGKK